MQFAIELIMKDMENPIYIRKVQFQPLSIITPYYYNVSIKHRAITLS